MNSEELMNLEPEAARKAFRDLEIDDRLEFLKYVNSSTENKAKFLSKFVGEQVSIVESPKDAA